MQNHFRRRAAPLLLLATSLFAIACNSGIRSSDGTCRLERAPADWQFYRSMAAPIEFKLPPGAQPFFTFEGGGVNEGWQARGVTYSISIREQPGAAPEGEAEECVLRVGEQEGRLRVRDADTGKGYRQMAVLEVPLEDGRWLNIVASGTDREARKEMLAMLGTLRPALRPPGAEGATQGGTSN